MCILLTELLLPRLGKGRVPDSLLGEDCLSFCGQATGWARLFSAVVLGGERSMKAPGQLTMGAVTGQSHCCGAAASQDETIQERLPKLLNQLLEKQMDGAQHIPPACPQL